VLPPDEAAADDMHAEVRSNIEKLMRRVEDARESGVAGTAASGSIDNEDEDSSTSTRSSGALSKEEQGTLIGTVEVSMTASTRTRFLTLNAPQVRALSELLSWQLGCG
jgi:hypothetical protein